MNAHENAESLSAYLDGEVSDEERARISAHVESCPECGERLRALEAASASLSSLEQVVPTPDESRVLRQTLIGNAPRRRFAPGVAALVGASAATVVALVALVLFASQQGRGPSEGGGTGEELQSAPALVFASEQEVREAVMEDPEVLSAPDRYTLGDVGAHQEEQMDALSPTLDAEEESGRLGQSADRETRVDKDKRRCLERVLETQPYPMMPLKAEPVTFEDTPAWFLVFAYASDAEDDDDPLDRIQVQILGRTNCSQLWYWTFRPQR